MFAKLIAKPQSLGFAPRASQQKYLVSKRFASNVRYTKDHEWIRVENGVGVVGITSFAANALGDVVYVDLPEVGRNLKQKDTVVAVESVKAASDVYAPASGSVTEVNSTLKDEPGTVNKSPLGDGWMVKLKLSNPKEVESLMDESAYKKHCEEADAHH